MRRTHLIALSIAGASLVAFARAVPAHAGPGSTDLANDLNVAVQAGQIATANDVDSAQEQDVDNGAVNDVGLADTDQDTGDTTSSAESSTEATSESSTETADHTESATEATSESTTETADHTKSADAHSDSSDGHGDAAGSATSDARD